MTVSSTTNRISYSCDGLTTVFPYTFKVFAEADLTVVLRDSAGTETTLTLTTHYSVSGVGASGGGNVTTVSTYPAGYTLVIKRDIDILQETDYIEGSAFLASSHEDALDKLTMIAQQLDEALDRSIKLPVSSSYTDLAIPDPAADKYLKWSNAATGIENADLVAYGDLDAHNNLATAHAAMRSAWYADNTSSGPVLLATAAEVVACSNASKVITPGGFASAWQYDEYYVPAGAMIAASTNGATISSQEYPTNKGKIDYAEFGQNNNEEAVLFSVALPRTWDRATLKAIPLWVPSYNRAISAASAVSWGFQALAWNDGSPIDTNHSTPPVYVSDTARNASTQTRHIGSASANFATAISGSDNMLELRVTRKNAGTSNNATAVIWLTGVLIQIKRAAACVGW